MSESEPNPIAPRLTAIVVHWRDEEHLLELVGAWPRGGRFELLVVDNSATAPALPPHVRRIDPGENLGFAGAVNRALAASRAELVLLLNPDARPLPGALEEILRGFEEHPRAAGIVPSLRGPDGGAQHGWQLRRLPGPLTLLLQTLLISGRGEGAREPAPGSAVEQPAAAALALRREALEEIGGMDEGFRPAWFEDVDLARRLARAGKVLVYHPAARFLHAQGSTVPRLGYGPFLWIYYRNLARYLRLHHGAAWVAAARALLPVGMAGRLLALPLRKPRRAGGRGEAARGLLAAAAAAVSGWRWPPSYRRRFPDAGSEHRREPEGPSGKELAPVPEQAPASRRSTRE